MKSFDFTAMESTCQKRATICEIYDVNENLIARESNRCNPPGGKCQRLGVQNSKADYPVESCNWTHAEINAVRAIPLNFRPHKAILYGHDFVCDNCEKVLREVGCKIIEVNPNRVPKFEPCIDCGRLTAWGGRCMFCSMNHGISQEPMPGWAI